MSKAILIQGGESEEEIIIKLKRALNIALDNDEPLICSFKDADYTFGHYEDTGALLKFGIKVIKRIAGNLQEQTGYPKEIIFEALLENAKEETSSGQKTDAEEEKPIH